MKSNIFIPKKINVGFVNRSDTYTKKLAYVIYYDQKGVLRKETSWNSWRDKDIPNELYDNEPMSGFVLNKKVGGYASRWNHRQTYVRVYDPRGFEFEITVPNLLYILENTSSIKGKGLEGEFTYGWSGTEILLIPTDSPDYKDIAEFNKIMHNNAHIKGKELKIGATYLTKDSRKLVFLGKHGEYKTYGDKERKKGLSFYFYELDSSYPIEVIKSLGDRIIDIVSEDYPENYADMIDKMECDTSYSPIDPTKDEYIEYTEDELKEKLGDRYWTYVYDSSNKKIEIQQSDDIYSYTVTNPKYESWGWGRNNGEPQRLKFEFSDISELIKNVKPKYLRKYLQNGKLYSEGW